MEPHITVLRARVIADGERRAAKAADDALREARKRPQATKGGRPEIKPAPAITPLHERPAYTAELGKLATFRVELANAESEFAQTQHAAAEAAARELTPERRDAERIATAERLVRGEVMVSDTEAIHRLRTKIDALKAAVHAQEGVVRQVTRAESRRAGHELRAEHARRVQRLTAALVELHIANCEEAEMREAMSRAGYDDSLPFMGFNPPRSDLDVFDPNGGYAPAWLRDARAYVGDAVD